ncbi:MAG: hypothetical protein U1D67_07485, partial [Dehalococcoidia bacterium]|nr:hypothetical protein [Dehalococcoidia bacterium]
MKRFIGLISVIMALTLVLLSVPWSNPPSRAEERKPVSKISSRLNRDLKVKTHQLQKRAQGQPQDESAPALATIPFEDASIQKLFLHFEKRPTAAQLKELEALGIKPYPDSWVPPVGSHPTGFIYAVAPVEKLPDLAAKQFVYSLETAES